MNLTYFVSIICLLFCLFFFFYVKWYIKRRTSSSELLTEYRTEVYRLITEVNAATDRDSRLVEDRIKKLKAILEDTDKRLAVYAREFERNKTSEALYTSLGRGIRAALKTPVEPVPSHSAPPVNEPQLTIVRQNNAQFSQTSPSETPTAALRLEPLPPQQKPSSKREIRAQIEELDNDGLSPAEIASRLDITLAEVDLALNLLHRRKNR